MISQAELFRRAAECERLMDLASDPKMREVFKHVREVWIALADDNLSRGATAANIAGIEKIQPAVEQLLLTNPLVRFSALHRRPDSLE
jgi:hypothetical protein